MILNSQMYKHALSKQEKKQEIKGFNKLISNHSINFNKYNLLELSNKELKKKLIENKNQKNPNDPNDPIRRLNRKQYEL